MLTNHHRHRVLLFKEDLGWENVKPSDSECHRYRKKAIERLTSLVRALARRFAVPASGGIVHNTNLSIERIPLASLMYPTKASLKPASARKPSLVVRARSVEQAVVVSQSG